MSGKGSTHLARHRAGHRLTQRQSILAKCADCMGGYADGREDCEIPDCPLHPFQPYHGAGRGQSAGYGRSVAKTASMSNPVAKTHPSIGKGTGLPATKGEGHA
jgi:hypothetical protein